MKHIAALAITLSVAASFVVAQEPAGPYEPAALAKAIAPFIDEQTIAVIHVDLSRADVDAAFAKVKQIEKSTMDHDVKELAEMHQMAGLLVSGFRKAGATDIYVVVSLADIPPEPILIVVPLADGADERAIRALVFSGRADGPTAPPPGDGRPRRHRSQVDVVRGAVVGTAWSIVERVRNMTPDPRPELAQAFAAAGESAAQLLILPTADNRRVVEELMPTLPAQVGGGPSTAVTRGVLWAAGGVQVSPKMSFRLVIQSQDEATAKSLQGLIPKLLQALVLEPLGSMRSLQKLLPNLEETVRMLTPRVAGSQLILALGNEQIGRLIAHVIVPPLRRSGQTATSMRSIHDIVVACTTYASTHKGQWPPDLPTLVKAGLIDAKKLRSPYHPEEEIGYVYIQPTRPAEGNVIVIYEKADPWLGGAGIGYADHSVRSVADQDTFNRLLAEAGKKPATKGK